MLASRDFQERIRAKIQALARQHRFTYTLIGERLHLSRSATSRLMRGQGHLTLEHLATFAELFLMSPAELIMEDDAKFQEVKPMAQGLLSRFRQMNEHERLSLLVVLDWRLKRPEQRRPRAHQVKD